MPKLIHFRENCIGCNSCVEHAPNYWEMDEADGKAHLKRSIDKQGVYQTEITDFEIDCNRCAAIDCPVGIIKIYADDGKDISKHS